MKVKQRKIWTKMGHLWRSTSASGMVLGLAILGLMAFELSAQAASPLAVTPKVYCESLPSGTSEVLNIDTVTKGTEVVTVIKYCQDRKFQIRSYTGVPLNGSADTNLSRYLSLSSNQWYCTCPCTNNCGVAPVVTNSNQSSSYCSSSSAGSNGGWSCVQLQ